MKNKIKDKPNVLMIGPGRNVMGGISTVVNSYFELGLHEKVNLKYISTMEDGNKLKKLFVAIGAYLKFISCIRYYDIVHIHMAAQASFTRKSLFVRKSKRYGKIVVIHQHAADFDEFYLKQSDDKKRIKIKEVFALADKVIVLSDEWEDFYGKYVCDKEKIEVLYNGVIIPDYIKEDYSDYNVLFLGRLGERKGSYDLLKAIPEVLKEVPDAMFYFGGDGDVEQSKKLTKEYGIENSVKFLGWIRNEEKEKYLKKCSVFILPSYHEGMPMSVLEAMSYGLATVSTNAGGIPQIIENGVNGIRIDAGDIDSISSVLVELLVNNEKKQILGKKAMVCISSKFNVKKTIDTIYELYVYIGERR